MPKRFILIVVAIRPNSSGLTCHFCGNRLSHAKTMELQEGEGFFYVCDHCAMSLDPFRLKQQACYRCASEGRTTKSIARCSICGKGICTDHNAETEEEEYPLDSNPLTKYAPALAPSQTRRQIFCDLCAAALEDDEE